MADSRYRRSLNQLRLGGLTTLAAVALVAATPAAASEQHPTLLELEGEIMCPTCHTTLDQSNSLEAQRIEAFISTRIRAGDTKNEITAKLVAQFGPAILAAPPRRGFDLIAWWLPIGGILAGALLLAVGVWRWSRAHAASATVDARAPLDAELERRLDEELARL
jgi:cytochrome c-type biogenesis protein CcmH